MMSTRTNSYILNNPTTFNNLRPIASNNSLLFNGSYNKAHDFANANALTFQNNSFGPPPPYSKEVLEVPNSKNMESIATDASTSEIPSSASTMSAMGIGMGLASLDSAINDFENTKIENQVRTGLGPNGHAFDAMTHAQNQVSQNNAHEAFRSSALMLGSALGPEGLLGAGIATLADYAVQAVSTPSENTTNSTSGNLINAGSLN